MKKSKAYSMIWEYAKQVHPINTHSHHMPDKEFKLVDLPFLLDCSYISWGGLTPDIGRANYLDRVGNKSFFVWLLRAVRLVYGIDEKLTVSTWDYYDEVIRSRSKDSQLQTYILQSICKYDAILLDAYWNPGDDNDRPDLFQPVYRVDPFFYAFDENRTDHDGNSVYKLTGKSFLDLDELETFLEQTVLAKKKAGCVALKVAFAYSRGLDVERVKKEEARKVFILDKAVISEYDVKAYQDYLFHFVCRLSAKYTLPLQVHTGLGGMYRTNAMALQQVICENRETKFVLFHGSYPWMNDICGLIQAYSNVYADLCWLPILSSEAAVRFLHELLEVATLDKICWGCDTWTSEESLGALLAVRHVLSDVLSSKWKSDWVDWEDAKRIVDWVLHENARRLYGLGNSFIKSGVKPLSGI